MAVFRTAVERWVDVADERDLVLVIRESFAELKALAAGSAS